MVTSVTVSSNRLKKTMTAKATPPNPRIYSPMPSTPIHPETRIGHVHLKVADLERALNFYTGVLGLQLTQRFGNQAAFISAGGYHHHIGLNTWESQGGSPPPQGTTGLYHLAILYPTRILSARRKGPTFPGGSCARHGP